MLNEFWEGIVNWKVFEREHKIAKIETECRSTFTIHVKHFQKLIVEIYKSLNKMNLSIVWELNEKVCKLTILGKQNYAKV